MEVNRQSQQAIATDSADEGAVAAQHAAATARAAAAQHAAATARAAPKCNKGPQRQGNAAQWRRWNAEDAAEAAAEAATTVATDGDESEQQVPAADTVDVGAIAKQLQQVYAADPVDKDAVGQALTALEGAEVTRATLKATGACSSRPVPLSRLESSQWMLRPAPQVSARRSAKYPRTSASRRSCANARII
jgi:hypothetical protein